MRGTYPLHDQDDLRYPSRPFLFEQGQSSWRTDEHLGVAKSDVFEDLVPPGDQLRGLPRRTRVDGPSGLARNLVPTHTDVKEHNIFILTTVKY